MMRQLSATSRRLTSGPVVIMARPFAPGNIGAVASAMANFGMSEMRIVQPQTPAWRRDPEAVAAAGDAEALLDAARTFETLHEATDDLHLVLATTARDRGRWGDGLGDSPVLSPRTACRRAADAVGAGQRVGLLFGSETNGLSRDELRSADVLVTVPTNPSFPSLNLAQAVLLLGYEYHSQAAIVTAASGDATSASREDLPATSGDVRGVVELWIDLLRGGGFFRDPRVAKAADPRAAEVVRAAAVWEASRSLAMGDKLRSLLRRSRPSADEVGLLDALLQGLAPQRQQRLRQPPPPRDSEGGESRR